MKKITSTVKQQARRARALARFTFNESKFKADDSNGYKARKDQELAALKARVGTRTPQPDATLKFLDELNAGPQPSNLLARKIGDVAAAEFSAYQRLVADLPTIGELA